jgi:hypothetical protein
VILLKGTSQHISITELNQPFNSKYKGTPPGFGTGRVEERPRKMRARKKSGKSIIRAVNVPSECLRHQVDTPWKALHDPKDSQGEKASFFSGVDTQEQ